MVGSWSSGSSGPRRKTSSSISSENRSFSAGSVAGQGRLQMRRQFLNNRVHLAPGVVVSLRRHLLQIDVVQQFAMDSDLQVLIDAEVQARLFFASPEINGFVTGAADICWIPFCWLGPRG